MELQALRYFLETARMANMSRAAERLHIAQSTMSKQIRGLEEELGARLFVRSNYSVRLTEAGRRLRERAEDLLRLADKTAAEFRADGDPASGEVFVGAAESESVTYFAEAMKAVRNRHPALRCHMYSGNMEEVCEKLDRGLLDFALVMRFVDLQKYRYLKAPAGDTWGVVMRKDAPLAKKKRVRLSDLYGLPLICSRQWLEQDFPHWFEGAEERIRIAATYNLSFNAFVMVRAGLGYAVGYGGLAHTGRGGALAFRPLAAVPKSEMYVIWRKNQTPAPSAKLLLDELRKRFEAS